MGIDFGALPPEVTSTMMYAGPGSSSLVAAASAWNALAAELASTAQGYDEVVTQLAGEEWLGPSSALMAAAVQPYVDWMTTTASQAEQAATRAQSAAAAFEAAFAAVVPPLMIADNRDELTQALQANLFGLNSGVIAQLEARYAEFWAQDAATMYSYAASSATASNVTPFTDAPQITNPAGSSLQSAATAASASRPASSLPPSIQSVLTSVTNRLQTLASPFIGNNASLNSALQETWFLLTGQTDLPTNLGTMVNVSVPIASLAYNSEGLPFVSMGMANFSVQIAKSAGWLQAPVAAAAAAAPKLSMPALGSGVAGVGGQISAGLGNGVHVGHLAVPSAWPGASPAPTVRPGARFISEPIPTGESGPGNLVGGVPMGAAGPARGAGASPRYGFKPTVMARPHPAG